MKGDKVEVKFLSENDEKDNFDRENYTKLLSAMTWKTTIGCKFYSDIDKNDENIDLGESYKICLFLGQDPGSTTKMSIWRKWQEIVEWNDMKYKRARN